MRRKHSRQLLRVAIIAALMGSLSAAAQNIPPGLTCVQATYPRNSVAVGGGVTAYCVPPAQAGIGSYSTCYTGANSNSTTVDVCSSSCIAEPATVNATLSDGYDPSAPVITVPINVTPPTLSLNIPGTVFPGQTNYGSVVSSLASASVTLTANPPDITFSSVRWVGHPLICPPKYTPASGASPCSHPPDHRRG